MNRLIPLLLLLLPLACRTSESPRPAPVVEPDAILTVAFYNLENLFDTDDDPTNSGDDEFTPNGPNRWTEDRLDRKLTHLSRAIRAMGDHAGPDLLGVCEVENRGVLDRLAGEFLPAGAYGVVHAESPDVRGIDVALLYRPAMMRHLRTTMHRVDLGAGERPTRDIMEVTFDRLGRSFTVLVNHWPSRSGGETESEPRRMAAAETAARVIDSLYRLDPAADIIVMGDFNDEPENRSIHDILDARGFESPFTHRLLNMAAPVAAADTVGSYYYKGGWETIDQIMLSGGILDDRGMILFDPEETVMAPTFLRDFRDGSPFRTYRGDYYVGGTSDHFPVFVRVGWK